MPEDVARKRSDEISSAIIQVLRSLYTAAKTVVMYPAGNPSVVRMVDSAFEAVTDLIPEDGSIDLSYMDDKLIVNGEMLDEGLQKRGIIANFHELLKSRKLSSVTFWSGLTPEELRQFLLLLGSKATPDEQETGELEKQLEQEGIEHIELDEQIYVAISKREKVVDAAAAVQAEEDASVKVLKDQVFARFLAGEVGLGEIDAEQIVKIASDPESMSRMIQGIVSSRGWDEGAGPLPFRVDETRAILERVSGLIDRVEDPLVKNKLSRELGKIASQIETPQLTELLMRTTGIESTGPELSNVLLPLIGDDKLTGVVETVIEEYEKLSREGGQGDWPSEKMVRLGDLIYRAAPAAGGDLAERLESAVSRLGVGTRGKDKASETGAGLARALAEKREARMDEASGPALIEAARLLFSRGNEEEGALVMSSLKERFERQPPETRSVAARQIWALLQELRTMGREAYAAELVDPVSAILDAQNRSDSAFTGLARSLEGALAAGDFSGELQGVSISGKALEAMMDSDTGRVVKAVYSSGDEKAMKAITEVLLQMEDRALPSLLDAAAAGDEQTLTSVADSIRETGMDPVPLIASRLSSDLERGEIINLVRLTAMVGDEGTVSVFNPLMLSEDFEVRMEVIAALGSLGGKQALQMVLSETGDPDVRIRSQAARHLGDFRDYLAVRRLLEIVTDARRGDSNEDDSVVMAACRSIGELNVRQAVGLLSDIARGGKRGRTHSDELRAAATAALGSIADEESRKALRKLLKDESMLIRSTARKALREP